MTVDPVAGPGAWSVSDFQGPADFTVRLTPEEVAELEAFLRRMDAAGKTLNEIEAADLQSPAVEARMREVYAELRDGRGFVVMAGLLVDRWPEADIERAYWAMGVQMGVGLSQSVMGDRLGHVRDMTREDPTARAYRNSSELNPHTDLAHMAALCCVKGAKSGGVSLFTSALSVHNAILAARPDYLNILYNGFYYHRRGEEQPGQAPVTPHRVPVFSDRDGKVSCRWVKPYAFLGQQAKGEPIEGDMEDAVDFFLKQANSDALQLRFTLAAGEIIWFNNLTLLHARTAFEDFDAPENRRHLLRLWLDQPDLRPQAPELEIYEGKGIAPVAGQTPSFDDDAAMRQMQQQATQQ